MEKLYAVALRNKKDGSVKSPTITDSLQAHLNEVRAFIHNNPTSAFTLFADDWEVVYKEITFNDSEAIELASWKKGETK